MPLRQSAEAEVRYHKYPLSLRRIQKFIPKNCNLSFPVCAAVIFGVLAAFLPLVLKVFGHELHLHLLPLRALNTHSNPSNAPWRPRKIKMPWAHFHSIQLLLFPSHVKPLCMSASFGGEKECGCLSVCMHEAHAKAMERQTRKQRQDRATHTSILQERTACACVLIVCGVCVALFS